MEWLDDMGRLRTRYGQVLAQSSEKEDWYWDAGSVLFVANHHGAHEEPNVEKLTALLDDIPVSAIYFLAHNNGGITIHHPSTLLPNPKGWDMTGAWRQAAKNSGKRFCYCRKIRLDFL